MSTQPDARPSASTPDRVDSSDVAIVGIGLRFPGAHGAKQFWANLRGGVESVQTFSDAELAARGVSPRKLSDPAYVQKGLVLENLEYFDPEFFGFSPKD
ncbi:MAG TPA: beta-ketoacyl synthase N-terminal-like domain-containing protein, partial [Planctomycetota bacterium]|nr:beta-ketoacyl synthase N-terminal-like domain-containing protein [Planctomycetota bacterium]